jgi:hypothetical protein
MSLEGLWTSQIYGLFGWDNTGVLILTNGKVIGGGNNHYSIGSYSEAGNTVEMSLDIQYHGTPKTVFGAAERQLSVTLQGTHDDNLVEGEVCRMDKQDLSLAFRLVRRADLP